MIRKIGVAILFSVIFVFGAAACEGVITTDSCCPTAMTKSTQDPWVCPSNCPGGGKTRISYEIEFKKLSNNESCDPTGTLTISVKDLTNNKDLTPLTFTSPPAISKKGTYEVSLTQDTEYEITASLDDTWCGKVTGKEKIKVVDPNDFHTICASGPLDPPKCTYSQSYVPFGQGVLIQTVANNSAQGANASMGVVVTKDGKTVTLQPYKSTTAFTKSSAAGLWTLGLDAPSCKIYANLPDDQQTECVDVYLMCNCP